MRTIALHFHIIFSIYKVYLNLGILNNSFIVPEEDLDWQPIIPAYLESIRQVIQLLDLLIRQTPPIKVKVCLNTLLVHTFGDNRPTLLDTPCKKHLLGSLALGLG